MARTPRHAGARIDQRKARNAGGTSRNRGASGAVGYLAERGLAGAGSCQFITGAADLAGGEVSGAELAVRHAAGLLALGSGLHGGEASGAG